MYSQSVLTVLVLVSTSLATNVYVNNGCIDVNNKPVCAPNQVYVDGGAATIAARFDSTDQRQNVVPGCVLRAQWPASYGDIYFGADNCLYDSDSKNINGQCCEPGSEATAPVPNPYA